MMALATVREGEGAGHPVLNLLAQFLVLPDDVHELAHQLVVALILEQLVPAPGGFEPALELIQHHSCRGNRCF